MERYLLSLLEQESIFRNRRAMTFGPDSDAAQDIKTETRSPMISQPEDRCPVLLTEAGKGRRIGRKPMRNKVRESECHNGGLPGFRDKPESQQGGEQLEKKTELPTTKSSRFMDDPVRRFDSTDF